MFEPTRPTYQNETLRSVTKMKQPETKTIQLSIRPTKEIVEQFATTLGQARRGIKTDKHGGISFESIEGLRNVLTKRRLELLSMVRHKKPRSVYELSKLVHRDLKSINTDLKILKDNDLIELKKVDDKRHRLIPKVTFSNIRINVTV